MKPFSLDFKGVFLAFAIFLLALQSCDAQKAVLVVGEIPMPEGDALFKERLENHGYKVSAVEDSSFDLSQAQQTDIILLSASVLTDEVDSAVLWVEKPVLCMESYMYHTLGMTGYGYRLEYGSARNQKRSEITDPDHPLALGQEQYVDVTTDYAKYLWGTPNENATVIASVVGDRKNALIFTYDKGAFMPGGVAPDKRAGFFATENTVLLFTDKAWDYFDALIDWMSDQR
jgi:hypothetical protein